VALLYSTGIVVVLLYIRGIVAVLYITGMLWSFCTLPV
jgi:hypothetical protein